MQADEGVFIADCDISRKNPKEIIEYLKTKYSLNHLQRIEMKQHSGTVLLPESEEGYNKPIEADRQ